MLVGHRDAGSLPGAEGSQRGPADRRSARRAGPARPTTRRPGTGRGPRRRPRGPGGSCRHRPSRSASPAARRRAGGGPRRSSASRPMSGVSCTGRLWRNVSSERSGGNSDGRSGWTTCQMCSGRPRSLRRCRPRSSRVAPAREGDRRPAPPSPPTAAAGRRGRWPGSARSGSARGRNRSARRGAGPPRCAPPSAPAARHPRGQGSAANACCAATAAATASEARLNAPTTLSPSPCSTGRTPPWPTIAAPTARKWRAMATAIASGASSQPAGGSLHVAQQERHRAGRQREAAFGAAHAGLQEQRPSHGTHTHHRPRGAA